jgi:serine phosphatase RsbU (regulator of sigma subunit)
MNSGPRWEKGSSVSELDGTNERESFMKSFVSIQTKMILQTMIIISMIFLVVLLLMIVKDLRSVDQSIAKSAKNIKNSIIIKGKLLAKNNSMAMAGMAEDNAFTSVQTLVSSAVKDDPDILYGIYMDSQSVAWAHASLDNPSGKMNGKQSMTDGVSLWAASLKEVDYKVYPLGKKEIIEFCAPVFVKDGIIGFIRYGISTESMNQALLELKSDSIRIRNQMIAILVSLAVVSLAISYFIVKHLAVKITAPIQSLVHLVKRIAEGDYNTPILSRNNDEIGLLESDVEKMRIAIKALTENLEQLVQERTNQLEEANLSLKEAMNELWGEMALAKKIQMALLPDKPTIPGYEICAYMDPADEVGGDYYDVINAAGKDWVVIGDVSGHGIPAGLIMMMTQTAIQSVVIEKPDGQPSDLIKNVNRVIAGNISRLGENIYMTLNVFAIHERGVFHFSGLHQDILIYRKSAQRVETVETTGMWIGMVDNLDNMVSDELLKIDIGDTLFLYTDGVTEAEIKNDGIRTKSTETMFGEKNLLNFFSQHGDKEPSLIKSLLIDTLKEYHRDDDVTFIIMKRIA